ncbi:post-GPI attachment to proteins factor 3-like [Haliotis asinina]|uniref:post-GPI attachment to proteins factor 3-like n=1 Tax=Haliotis asinina TaxID=109174 RepID=UPI0035323932
MYSSIISVVAVSLMYVSLAGASAGDRSWFHQKCVRNCYTANCSNVDAFLQKQPYHLQLLHWNCIDECKYECMWSTVDAFRRDGSGVPQFHGKWPFVRILGIQEPASTLFSILNGLSHLGLVRFRSQVSKSTPLYYVWHGAAVVAVNAWTWSTVFHTRDTDFTEKMDYFFAFSIVLYNVFIFSCRILGTKVKWRPCLVSVTLLLIYVQHIYYLAFIKFDYGYNMKMNLGIGAVNMVGWLIWCAMTYKKQRYVWKCAAVVVGINALLLLELFDFPPFWWALDAHALWHAGTAPLGLLWYSFIIDDSLYLKQREEDMALKLD